MATMPMFPLGSVLMPGGLIPLHVFEPRYRDMIRDCLRADGEPEFGQVLITRGREAGGGDERAMVGTVAQMLQVEALDDQRYALIAVGTRRIVVEEWLVDDPYPRAAVSEWPDTDVDDVDVSALVAALETRVRSARLLAADVLRLDTDGADTDGGAEVGDDVVSPASGDVDDDDFDIAEDPVLASYHLCTVAPIGPADRLRLLSAPGPVERLDLLDTVLDDVEAMLKFRLS